MPGRSMLGRIRPVGADSEHGRLRTVLMHRPGLELKRITPRTRHLLQFDGLPWPARAQQEHDGLAEVLRTRGVEVIYLTELLQDVLEYQVGQGRVDHRRRWPAPTSGTNYRPWSDAT